VCARVSGHTYGERTKEFRHTRLDAACRLPRRRAICVSTVIMLHVLRSAYSYMLHCLKSMCQLKLPIEQFICVFISLTCLCLLLPGRRLCRTTTRSGWHTGHVSCGPGGRSATDPVADSVSSLLLIEIFLNTWIPAPGVPPLTAVDLLFVMPQTL